MGSSVPAQCRKARHCSGSSWHLHRRLSASETSGDVSAGCFPCELRVGFSFFFLRPTWAGLRLLRPLYRPRAERITASISMLQQAQVFQERCVLRPLKLPSRVATSSAQVMIADVG